MKETNHKGTSKHRVQILTKFTPGRFSSRAELARETGLSAATVSRITRGLVQDQILTEVIQPSTDVGRPTRALEINPASGTVLGISLLVPVARVLIMDLKGGILKEVTEPISWDRGPTGVLDPLKRAVQTAVRQRAAGTPRRMGVGLALPGQWDRDKGTATIYPRIPEWRNVPIRALLEEWTDSPTTILGHAPALAVAEHSRRHAESDGDLLCVQVTDNIACGVIANGRVLEGTSGNPGELGHITLDPTGPVCYCGNRGCLEMLATCSSIVEEIRGSDVAAGLFPDRESITYEAVVRLARDGDAFCGRLLARVSRTLGVGLATALSLFNPRHLILTGEFFKAEDLVLDPLRSSIREHAIPSAMAHLTIERSSLGPAAPALGAGIQAIREAVHRL